ncbi:MAG TPA: carboxypeptidase regulatory-like domain-containing protein [Pyrinomonadaceae bacterium]|nr:carboxypeptidase regulatory-like domain-containing protein [Pyrinomonadaceae bacterium]
MKYTKRLTFFLLAALLSIPLFVVHGAGGRIEGKITDPKGAGIPGASVTVTNQTSKQEFTAVTDAEGRYKVEGLPAGTYEVTVAAKGFKETRQANVKVEDDGVKPVDVRLEIASLEAQVKVATGSQKGNLDPIYQNLRQLAKLDTDFAGSYATVNNLTLKRDAAKFTLKTGEIYFLAPVENRYTGAVFIGTGEMSMTPPTQAEKNSIRIFTEQDGIVEQFSSLVLRFTDKTYEEVKASPNVTMKTAGPAANQAREMYRSNMDLLRKRLRDNRELRTLQDIYNPSQEGYFNAFINGSRFNKLVFVFDPFGVPGAIPEEVALYSYGESDGGMWAAFHREDEFAKGTASSSEDRRIIDITQHDIDAAIKGAHLTVTDRVTFKNLIPGTRVVPFNLYGALRVTSVQDAEGVNLNFIQESKDEDSDFGVILSKPLEAGQTHHLVISFDGDGALRDSGGGNFILTQRSTWYPANANTLFGEDRAIYNMTFRYPKQYTFVGTGAQVEPDTRDGDTAVAKWSSGKTELAVAGFNYGRFKRKEVADKDSGYNVEFYANVEVPDELKAIQRNIEQAESQGVRSMTTLSSISTTAMADPAIADAQNSMRIYNIFFGKLPYTRIAMTQQPAAGFGQAWPTLVFMPYLAYIDTTQRSQLLGTQGGTDTFWRYVAPHEVAHQWWGHIIGWDSYRDQWMSEGFAEFSASLYVQLTRGNEKFVDFWEDLRQQVVQASPATRGRKPYTIGPVTQGYRLNNAKTGGAARFLIYPKGAYILHMLRMMMYKQGQGGDAAFQAMMKDFVQTHYNQPVSTEDFKRAVEKHITKEMDIDKNGKMDWFFDEWVYGTEVPAYKFEYSVSKDGMLNAKITQSGVSERFVMLVPIYVDMGKGWAKLGSAQMAGSTTTEIKDLKLPAVPKRMALCAMNDVLATSIENSK